MSARDPKIRTMAVPAPNGPKRVDSSSPAIRIVDHPSNSPEEFTAIQWLVVQGYGSGASVGAIARKYANHLIPHEPDEEKRLKKARQKIRKWIRTQKFRDAIWAQSVVELDLESPAILKGITRKARAGRVDAARLAFELNGRHSPHTEVQPASININFGAIPRPHNMAPIEEADEIVEGEVDEIED